MSMNDRISFDDTAIWVNRKAALISIAEDILPKEEDVQIPDELNKLPEDLKENLKEALKEDGVPYGQRLERLFQLEYERRQREICRRQLNLLMQFTEDAAAFLERSDDNIGSYSSRYLWRMLLNEASTDLQIIQAAVQQRTLVGDSPNSQAQNLFMADIISEHALGQAVENRFLKQTPIITYLKEDISVRPVPYAEVMLISIAYATMLEPINSDEAEVSFRKVSRDLLAIPHEVGHHLFWKGQMPGKNRSVYRHLQKRLKRAKIWEWDWRRAWLEEIFADAYGLLVAGPVMALSFQDLLTDNPQAQFREDTGHHPIPALRPYIQTRILCGITGVDGTPLYKWAPIWLDEQWKKLLKDNFSREWASADPLEVEYKLHGVAHPMKGWQILEALDKLIKIILKTLRGPQQGANRTHDGWKAWTTDVHKDDEELLGLYDNLSFENFPLKSRWLQDQVVAGQASGPKNWPDQILSGWSVEGPEHRGGG